MTRDEENALLLVANEYDAICRILAGEEVSDFALSFSVVRKVADLYQASITPVQGDAESCGFAYCQKRESNIGCCEIGCEFRTP